MRFAFIHTEKARCTVQALCRALDVSPSGFYAWCRRPESAHAQRDRQLRVLIRASHEASRYRYGSPRVHEDLIEQGVPISRKRVVRLMRAEGLTARVRKRFKCTTLDLVPMQRGVIGSGTTMGEGVSSAGYQAGPRRGAEGAARGSRAAGPVAPTRGVER